MGAPKDPEKRKQWLENVSTSNIGKHFKKGLFGKFGKDNPNYGSKRSQKTKDKLSKALSGENNPMYGKDRRDEKNGNWKGDIVKYRGLHCWVTRKKGLATNYKCVDCNKHAHEWSNIDHMYKRNIDDYAPRCRACHRKYDKKFIR